MGRGGGRDTVSKFYRRNQEGTILKEIENLIGGGRGRRGWGGLLKCALMDFDGGQRDHKANQEHHHSVLKRLLVATRDPGCNHGDYRLVTECVGFGPIPKERLASTTYMFRFESTIMTTNMKRNKSDNNS